MCAKQSNHSASNVAIAFENLLSLDAALARINALPVVTSAHCIALENMAATPAILARDVCALQPVPPFANSAVDGYALHQADIDQPGALDIIGTTKAGDSQHVLRPGCTVAVLTGSILPRDTAAVVMHEDTDIIDGKLHIRGTMRGKIRHRAHCRDAAEDFAPGDTIARAGIRLGSYHVAAMIASGLSHIEIMRPLRVGVLSCGNELHTAQTPLPEGHIRDTNRASLQHFLTTEPVIIDDLGAIGDDQAMLQAVLAQANQCDLIIISAGMSSSDADFTAAMMRHHRLLFWQLAIKPARPVGLCQLDDGRYVLGLPGNAAACVQAAWLIGLPLIARLMGGQATLPRGYPVRLLQDVQTRLGRREFPRARLHQHDTGLYAEALPASSAGLSLSLQADGVLDLPAQQTFFAREEEVYFLPFPARLYDKLAVASSYSPYDEQQ